MTGQQIESKRIVVVGAGYVGLVTGACFASVGNKVMVVEKDEGKINTLLQGKIPFFEPGLDKLVKKCQQNGHLVFLNDIAHAISQGPDFIFLCVGTPPLDDGSADLSFIMRAAEEIGENLNSYCIIVDKSTVPVGTAHKVKNIIVNTLQKRTMDVAFDVASNPEFLREGSALEDFFSPDRIVIGIETKRTEDALQALYKPFVASSDQCIAMNMESAELTKYASNSMLAARISFMNQLAQLSEKVGADIEQIKKGMAKDRRIGPLFLNAGIGYGGSCFPKDVTALICTGKQHGVTLSLLQEVDQINKEQRQWFLKKIFDYYGDTITKKHLGIWGLAFKPNTDDIRGAPSVDIIAALLEKGVKITAYDPKAVKSIQAIFGDNVSFVDNANDILNTCDGLIVLTEHKEFIQSDPQAFLRLKDGVVFDGRNCLNQQLLKECGVRYISVGRSSVNCNIKN